MEVTTTSSINLLNVLLMVALSFTVLSALFLAALFYSRYFLAWLRSRDREKGALTSALLQVSVPRDNEIKIDAMEQLLGALYSIRKNAGFLKLKPQPTISFEIVALHESIQFYVSCHKSLQDLIEKQIHGAYPDASVKVSPEYNIFSEGGESAYAMYKLRAADYYPIKTYRDLPTDPLSAITSAMAKMQPGEGAVIQMIIAPADNDWKNFGKKFS